MSQRADEMQALVRAAREAQVETDLLIECIQRRLIFLNEGQWSERSIEQAKRVRRLLDLGVNLQGVEVIFHMRRRTIRLQREMEVVREEMERMRQRHEREISRLLREISQEI